MQISNKNKYNFKANIMRRKSDRFFLITTIVLVLFGIAIFTSASLGLLAKNGATFSSVALKQILFGVIGGGIALILLSNIHYRQLKKYSFYIFFLTLVLSMFVFVPFLGLEHGGAKRWISVAGISFQPAEFLKLGFIIYLAAMLSTIRSKIGVFKYGVLPLIILSTVTALVLLSQPDTGTLLVILISALFMFLSIGGRWKHVIIVGIIAVLAVGILISTRPYIKERVLTFMDPSRDSLGAGYQIQQSLITIGSGEITGRGFGQSIQKFSYLPEPIGDSIFAVASEEFGFIGSVLIIIAFVVFSVRGIYIAQKAPDYFSGLLALGIVILIVSQSFINIASMLGVFPLTGLPLLFISKGGTAMFAALAGVGIILNISKYRKN